MSRKKSRDSRRRPGGVASGASRGSRKVTRAPKPAARRPSRRKTNERKDAAPASRAVRSLRKQITKFSGEHPILAGLAASEAVNLVKGVVAGQAADRGIASTSGARRGFRRNRDYASLCVLLRWIEPNATNEEDLVALLGPVGQTYDTTWEVVTTAVPSKLLSWRTAQGGQLMVRLSPRYERGAKNVRKLVLRRLGPLVVDGYAYNEDPDGLGRAFQSVVPTGKEFVLPRTRRH
jgi:hypothetical protein